MTAPNPLDSIYHPEFQRTELIVDGNRTVFGSRRNNEVVTCCYYHVIPRSGVALHIQCTRYELFICFSQHERGGRDIKHLWLSRILRLHLWGVFPDIQRAAVIVRAALSRRLGRNNLATCVLSAVRWRWWKVGQCLPTGVDKGPPSSPWREVTTITQGWSLLQPASRW